MIRLSFFFLIYFILYSYCELPQVNYNVTQLITSRGYPCEDHLVTTEDGYILSMQHMPNNGPPVLLQHGFLDSSATWVMNSEKESLAFILFDAGFDVWLGNSRGNIYCQKNINFDNSTQDFWNFSWSEMAIYDLPAKINYVLSLSSYSTLSYIGHSEGTLMGFTEFSSNTTIANKINIFIALAPIVYLTNVGEALQLAADVPPFLVKDIFGTMSFFAAWSEEATLIYDVCSNDDLVCESGVCVIAGCELGNLNKTMLPVYFSHFPAGSSVQDLLHYQQSVNNHVYQQYDYGSPSANEAHYNQSTPPTYSLSTLYTPTALFYGSHDKMADATDVSTIIQEMPIPPYYQEEIRGYGHADFVWGSDAHRKLYPTVVSLLQEITST